MSRIQLTSVKVYGCLSFSPTRRITDATVRQHGHSPTRQWPVQRLSTTLKMKQDNWHSTFDFKRVTVTEVECNVRVHHHILVYGTSLPGNESNDESTWRLNAPNVHGWTRMTYEHIVGWVYCSSSWRNARSPNDLFARLRSSQYQTIKPRLIAQSIKTVTSSMSSVTKLQTKTAIPDFIPGNVVSFVQEFRSVCFPVKNKIFPVVYDVTQNYRTIRLICETNNKMTTKHVIES